VNRSHPVIRSLDRLRRRAPYLVRLIKPNLIASHDWHVQPICQRSLRAARLSETLGSRPESDPKIELGLSSNSMRNACFPGLALRTTAFWRELFKPIKVPVSGQAENPSEPRSATRARRPIRAAQILKDRPAKMPEPLRLAGDRLPGHAMACSL
jgi:hypothetical protein